MGGGGEGALEAGAGQDTGEASRAEQETQGTMAGQGSVARPWLSAPPPKKMYWGNPSLVGALEAETLGERALEKRALDRTCKERALEGAGEEQVLE